jgi:drug efflux transport system permease protein
MLRSVLNVVRKELRQTLRDRQMVRSLILAPVLQLVIFGYAINLDVDRIPTVVCDRDGTPRSRDLVQQFLAGGTFRGAQAVQDPAAALGALETGDAAVALIIPQGFSARSARHDSPEVQVLVDGTDSTRAQVASNAAAQILRLQGIGGAAAVVAGGRGAAVLAPRILYNPRLSTPVYMLPGILATLLLNVTAIASAMALARERETGTLEQVLVTPMRPAALLAGKCLPFILFGLIDIAAVLVLGSWIFEVPMRGSLAVVALGSFLYLFSTIGFGILLATLSATQQQAMLGAFAFVLPAALLSGFMSPIDAMPRWLQPLTLLNPMRHFVEIARSCLLKGAGVGDLAGQLVSLIVLGTGLLAVAVLRFRKRVA